MRCSIAVLVGIALIGCAHSPTAMRSVSGTMRPSKVNPTADLVSSVADENHVSFRWIIKNAPKDTGAIIRGSRARGVTDGFSKARLTEVSVDYERVSPQRVHAVIETKGTNDYGEWTGKTDGMVDLASKVDLATLASNKRAQHIAISKSTRLIDCSDNALVVDLVFGKVS